MLMSIHCCMKLSPVFLTDFAIYHYIGNTPLLPQPCHFSSASVLVCTSKPHLWTNPTAALPQLAELEVGWYRTGIGTFAMSTTRVNGIKVSKHV